MGNTIILTHPPLSLCSVFAQGSALNIEHRTLAVGWQLAEEVPIAFVYNTIPHAVMMASPADLEDFALGFSIAEEIIKGPDALLVTKIEPHGPGWRLCLGVDPDHLGRGFSTRRGLAGHSGCGLCGIEDMEHAVRTPQRIPASTRRPDTAAINRAFENLPLHQPMNCLNHSVHAAAYCDLNGQIIMCREDVGRHNALDKLIGGMLRTGLTASDGFVIMTSRCSFELVQKAAAASIPLLATISAPTSLAVDLAARAGMSLAAQSRPGEIIMFG